MKNIIITNHKGGASKSTTTALVKELTSKIKLRVKD